MPSQRRPAGSRARGSWLPRLAGIGVVVVLAVGAVTAYLVVVHPAKARPVLPLSNKVITYQTVGLVAQETPSGSGSQQLLLQLLSPASDPEFSRISPAELGGGPGQWTADLMVGKNYIFIYLASGDCLSAVGTARSPRLALRHCDLRASQRWRRVGPAVLSQGHDFYQYANLGDGSCLAQARALPGSAWGASLSACSPTPPADQLIAFWWATA
jgi:hypothetical protein